MKLTRQSIIVALFITTSLPAAETRRIPISAPRTAADADRGEYRLFHQLVHGNGPRSPEFTEQVGVPVADNLQVEDPRGTGPATNAAQTGGVRAAQNLEVAQGVPRVRMDAPQSSYLPNLKPLRASSANRARGMVPSADKGRGELTPPQRKQAIPGDVETLPPPLAGNVAPEGPPVAFQLGYQVDPDVWLRQKIQACGWNANQSPLHRWLRNQQRNRSIFGRGILGSGCDAAGWGSCGHASCHGNTSCNGSPIARDATCYGESCEFRHGWLLSPDPEQLTLGGWVAMSGAGNMADPKSVRYNGPVTFVDRVNEFQMNQLYMYLERPVRDHGISLGGRVDLLYGTDARFTLASGLDDKITLDRTSPDYKLAIPQLYAEAGLGSMSVKFGHFFTILGYEVVGAPENFFITHSYSMQYGEPFTHTGMLAEVPLGSQWTMLGGFTRGWDNWSDNNTNLDVLAGIQWVNRCEDLSLGASITSGPQDDAGLNNRTVGSVVLGMQLTERLKYVLQTDLGYEDDATVTGQDAEWYGVVNYVTCALNDCLTIGTRYEWFADDDGVRVRGLGPPQGSSLLPHAAHWQEAAVGVTVQPTGNILVRNEIRWDWVSAIDGADYRPFDDFSSRAQALWATDIIVGF